MFNKIVLVQRIIIFSAYIGRCPKTTTTQIFQTSTLELKDLASVCSALTRSLISALSLFVITLQKKVTEHLKY